MLSYNLSKQNESTCNDSKKANQVCDPKIISLWLNNKISYSHIVEAALKIYSLLLHEGKKKYSIATSEFSSCVYTSMPDVMPPKKPSREIIY